MGYTWICDIALKVCWVANYDFTAGPNGGTAHAQLCDIMGLEQTDQNIIGGSYKDDGSIEYRSNSTNGMGRSDCGGRDCANNTEIANLIRKTLKFGKTSTVEGPFGQINVWQVQEH